MIQKEAILSVHLLVEGKQRTQVLLGQLEIQPLINFLIIWTEEIKMESWKEKLLYQYLKLLKLHQAINLVTLMELLSQFKDSWLMC